MESTATNKTTAKSAPPVVLASVSCRACCATNKAKLPLRTALSVKGAVRARNQKLIGLHASHVQRQHTARSESSASIALLPAL